MRVSQITRDLKQSGIRAASSRCAAIGGINLGQGVCDLPIETAIKAAAIEAINGNKSIYSPCEGIYPLRQAIATKMQDFNKITYDAATEIIVTHGSTGGFICAVTTLFNPGDEVIVFEPFYGYHKKILELKGMRVAAVALDPHDLSFKLSDIESVINSNTKGIIICTPNNPTGKVYTREELLSIGALAEKHNLWVITDEIYEYITYDNFQHISFASLKKFKDRTITISGFSKTYNMTGWRLGYACGPADIIEKMALVQDLIYVCPATPLQHAALSALHLQAKYYVSMNDAYTDKRKLMVTALRNMGFEVAMPQGAYYLMADFSKLNLGDDISAQTFLLEQAKVATVAGRYFYHIPNLGQKFLRFCYALDEEKLTLAMQQIAKSLKINATRKLEWV